MISNDDTCEDEWTELRARFSKEGLEYSTLSLEQRLLHVWRWLVDAESNLLSSRRMLDKLREQQNEDLEDMECYMGHIRELAEKRADLLESETVSLRNKLDLTQQQTATLNSLLQRCGLQGIDGLGEDSLGEQVALLIADRSKLMEEIDILKRIKFSNGISKESDMLSEMVKVSSEKEVLRKEVGDMCERLQLLEKASRQLELDNERLAYKLSEALAELEEREAQLKQLGGGDQITNVCESLVWASPQTRHRPQQGCARSYSLHSGLCRRELSNSSLRTVTGEIHEDQENLTRNQSASSLLEENSEQEGYQDLGQSAPDRASRTDTRSFGADSTPPSLLLSEPSCGSPKRLASLVDSQAASRSDFARNEEIKQLQTECGNLKEQQAVLAEKYNTLVFRHIRYKTKRKAQVEELRRCLDAKVSTLNCQIETLQTQLTLQKKALLGEETFRKRVEADYRRLQEEKRSLVVSMLSAESTVREKEREISTLKKKATFLEGTTADILARMLTLKYAGGSPSSIPSSVSASGISEVTRNTTTTTGSGIPTRADTTEDAYGSSTHRSLPCTSSESPTGTASSTTSSRVLSKRHSVTDLGMV